MNTKANNPIRKFFLYGTVLTVMLLTLCFGVSNSPVVHAQGPVTPTPDNPYFKRIPRTLSNGQSVEGIIINGPPDPTPGLVFP